MNAAAVQKQARPLPRQAVLVLERAGPPPERTGPPPDEPALQSVQNKGKLTADEAEAHLSALAAKGAAWGQMFNVVKLVSKDGSGHMCCWLKCRRCGLLVATSNLSRIRDSHGVACPALKLATGRCGAARTPRAAARCWWTQRRRSSSSRAMRTPACAASTRRSSCRGRASEHLNTPQCDLVLLLLRLACELVMSGPTHGRAWTLAPRFSGF